MQAPAHAGPHDVPISELGTRYRLLGRLHQPLGTVVIVQGFVVEGPGKGYEGGPNVRVQRINGRATQEDIQLKLRPYFTDFGKVGFDGLPLPRLESGKTYEFEGYETGEFVGVPEEAFQRAGIVVATTGFYFRVIYTVYKGREIDSIHWAPADFVDRRALLAGLAVSEHERAYIVGAEWKLMVDANSPWPKRLHHRAVEGDGVIRTTDTPGTYRLESGTARLVDLQDQLGSTLALRGIAWSLNGHWWFEYRGIDMYVENMQEMPGWCIDLHGRPIEITGLLEEATLPAIDQISLKSDRESKKYFIVRTPSWRPIDALLSPERVE